MEDDDRRRIEREREIAREEVLYAQVRELVEEAVQVAEQLEGGWGGTCPADLVIEYASRLRPPDPPAEQVYRKRPIPEELRWEVFKRDGFICQHCGAQDHLRADHIEPEVHGGEAALGNLQTLCSRCNSRKGSRRR